MFMHLNNQHLATLKVQRDNLLILLSLLQYLLKQGLAIRGHEEMNGNLMLHQANGNYVLQSFISDKHCISSEIINETIILMSRTVLLQVLVEIRKACWFSVIAHETTDVSHKEQLCTAIRWVDNLFQIVRLMCIKYIHLHHSTYLPFCVSLMGSVNCLLLTVTVAKVSLMSYA